MGLCIKPIYFFTKFGRPYLEVTQITYIFINIGKLHMSYFLIIMREQFKYDFTVRQPEQVFYDNKSSQFCKIGSSIETAGLISTNIPPFYHLNRVNTVFFLSTLSFNMITQYFYLLYIFPQSINPYLVWITTMSKYLIFFFIVYDDVV